MSTADFPEQLTLQDCPLLAKANLEHCEKLLERYNRAANFYRVLERGCSEPILNSFIRPAAESLASIAVNMRRVRYRIGFLGGFQAGKSTSFNRVLGVENSPDAPSKEGDSDATTATITRLKAISSGEHHAVMRYMLESEAIERRNSGCLALKLAHDVSDDQLYQELMRAKREAEENSDPTTAEACARMQRFLQSYKAYRPKVRKTEAERIEEPLNWKKREEILNHADPKKGTPPLTPTLVLESVLISYRTDRIPAELEMIDLPGLGSTNIMDDALTDQFLKKLDGALVFCRAETVSDVGVDAFLKNLRKMWRGKLDGRVWLCYTKVDSLNEAQFRVEKSFFHNVKEYAGQRDVPPNQICLVCNKADRLAEKFRDLSVLTVPEVSLFAKVWQDIYTDGGLEALRTIILERVPVQVGEGILRQCDTDLKKIEREFVNAARDELTDPSGDQSIIRYANACVNRMGELVDNLESSTQWMREQILELQDSLQTTLDNLEISPKSLDKRGDMPQQFQRHSAELEKDFRLQTRREMIKSAYQQVLPQIQELEGMQTMRIPGTVASKGMAAALEDFQQADEATTSWYPVYFPSFEKFDPFKGLAVDQNPLDGAEYLKLLQNKIRTVTRQLAQTLRRRILERFSELQRLLDDFCKRTYNTERKQGTEEFRREASDFATACGLPLLVDGDA